MKLYYSPGAVSFAVHVVLRELQLDFELVATPTGDEAHQHPDYLALNPVGRVPTLVTPEGGVLTEMTAILRYLARGEPKAALYPEDRWAQARCDELLSRIASLAHPNYRMVVRPDRFLPGADQAALDAVQAAARTDFARALDHLERDLPAEGWAIDGQLTVADPYLSVMWMWARFGGFDLERWPKLRALAGALLARPSARACFIAEGLVDDDGRPTPPARV